MNLYHYTCKHHLPKILTSGLLRLTESNVSMTEENAGPRVVWLTTADSVRPGTHGLNRQRGGPADKTVVRFTVTPTSAVPWFDSEVYAAMTPSDRAAFIAAGGGPAMAETWWVSDTPIRRPEWTALTVEGQPHPLRVPGLALGLVGGGAA